jgi:5-methylcytosine-specific restriction endonuclease McrBC GTP-binding regulatory subunit McrB
MHNTTLDLFCNDDNNDNDNIDAAFDRALEEQAAKYEVTVDYYMEEFLI